jgi:hypothetical protein
LAFADGLRQQVAELPPDGNPAGLPSLARSLVLAQDDHIGGPVDVGNRRPAQFTRTSATLRRAE